MNILVEPSYVVAPAECPALAGYPEASNLPAMETDTVIVGMSSLHFTDSINQVGNGPSAMILSYILHGHIPFYSPQPPHPDHLLHAKLEKNPQLLDADVRVLTEHFPASRLSYSTQALPVNVLLDTLVRPSVDVNDDEYITNVEWRHMPEKAVPHMIFSDAPQPGGQWSDNPLPASWNIQTLSYATMLSLPGYSFAEHYFKTTGAHLPAFTRPTRQEVADYFQAYPKEAGIDDVFRCNQSLGGISRTNEGFYISSHQLHCKHLVLASGVFSEVIQPRPLLRPLLSLHPTPQKPLLVIGSGFSAADVIISAPKNQKILHIYKWDPEERPSPLRSCHHQAYPEYAGVYRLMKRAAVAAEPQIKRPKNRRTVSTPFLQARSWDEVYEGLPNTEIIDVNMQSEDGVITLRQNDGTILRRSVCGLVHATGRRGTLRYLENDLRSEVLDAGSWTTDPIVTGQTLRNKALENLEVAQDVFIIGSLTGDSLIRFSYGSCVQAAGRLIEHGGDKPVRSNGSAMFSMQTSPSAMNGIDGHYVHRSAVSEDSGKDAVLPMTEKFSFGGLWRSVMRMLQ